MNLYSISNQLSAAQCPEDVFGDHADKMIHVYRKLVSVVHPDNFIHSSSYELATSTCSNLTKMKEDADRKIAAKIYGNRKKSVPEPFEPRTLSLGDKSVTLHKVITEGDTCIIYDCTVKQENRGNVQAALKIVRSGKDNDLLENEAAILKLISGDRCGYSEEARNHFLMFLPEILDTFVVRAPGSQRRAHLMPNYSEYRSLQDVMDAYPDGLNTKDMVWMFKRILHGLGFPHKHNVVHGGIVPSNVLVHPISHGAKILDWSFSVDTRNKHAAIKGINKRYKDYYPEEVFQKKKPAPSTDVYMAVKCAIALVGGLERLPPSIEDFFLGCLELRNGAHSSWEVHSDFDVLLKSLYGRRKYRPLIMPS